MWVDFPTLAHHLSRVLMNSAQSVRLLSKCVEIYQRNDSLMPVQRFLERLESRGGIYANVTSGFWDEVLMPEIHRRYFKGVGVDELLERAISVYRSIPDSSSALVAIWREVEWKYPFDQENYSEFIERLEVQLGNEPNPPTREDWDHLDECLMK